MIEIKDQNQLQNIWRSVLGELELLLGRTQLMTWFKNTSILKLDEHEVLIGTQSTFNSTWLQSKYSKQILDLVKKHSNLNIEKINFTTNQQSNSFPNTKINNINLQNHQSQQIIKKQQISIPEFGLNPRYSFETFVVGKGNELAYAAAQAVADSPGLIYNPLFIYGGVGLGKTHLMQAIGNKIKAIHPQKKILYISSEKFMNDFIYSIKQNTVNDFKRKYRNVDVLLVDDIQFISGKESTQEEFFHTFNELYQNNRQIVLTSDRPPKEIESLEQRLLSRFEWGMIADIRTPDLETRIAILQNKAQDKGLILDNESITFIAEAVTENVRELEGVLNKLLAYQQVNNMPLSIENIKIILGKTKISISNRKKISPENFLNTVAKYFNISKEDILSKKRSKHLVYPRQILCYLLKEEANYSYPAIGKFLNGRDHTTILHAVNKIEKNLNHDEVLRDDIENLKKELK